MGIGVMQTRRGLITGLISLVAAPAIIRVNHLMPISGMPEISQVVYNMERYLWKYVAPKILICDAHHFELYRDELIHATEQEIENRANTDGGTYQKVFHPLDITLKV
jgi:hypothetical protein